jgi:radial spoke head protein 4A
VCIVCVCVCVILRGAHLSLLCCVPLQELPSEELEGKARSQLLSSIDRVTKMARQRGGFPEEEEEEEAALPDIMANAELLEWAGLNIGKEETYKLLLSIQEFLKVQNEQEPVKNVRYFGKIFGTQADYHVVEAQFTESPEVEVDESLRMEQPGEGANQYVYFVTTSLEGKWTQLPHVLPKQVQLARQMRRYFTGDLKAPVLGFPRFPWGEASYLRAQIARIASSTTISPAGWYIPEEDADDENAIVVDPEYSGAQVQDIAKRDGWVHHRPYLRNKQNRVAVYVEPERDEDEEEEAPEEEEEEEEVPSALKSVDEDVAEDVLGNKKVWSIRVAPSKSNPHAVVSAHSLVWPGAVAIAKRKTLVNIYVGYGHKFMSTNYTPPAPPAIQGEYKATFNAEEEEDPLLEQVDPQPKKVEENAGADEDDEDEDEEDNE